MVKKYCGRLYDIEKWIFERSYMMRLILIRYTPYKHVKLNVYFIVWAKDKSYALGKFVKY